VDERGARQEAGEGDQLAGDQRDRSPYGCLGRQDQRAPGDRGQRGPDRPDEYSLVITSTPSTANSTDPKAPPTRMLLVTSPWGFLVLNPAAMPMPIIPASASSRVQRTERRVRSLIHSIRATCRNR
jgi:hypothetical protein